MKNKIVFVIFLTNIVCAMDRSSVQTVVTTHTPLLRLHQQAPALHTSEGDSRGCCAALGNLVLNAPIALCLISADYAMTGYIQTLDYLATHIKPSEKIKTE